MVNITWNDAQACCEWLGKKDGKAYRLPTEAQWEYACRAGSSARFWTGDAPGSLSGAANVRDQSFKRKFPNENYERQPIFDFDDGWPFTAPVATFKPNAFGLYDMTGNVCQWCQDWYAADYFRTSPADDPPGPNSGSSRVLRGRHGFTIRSPADQPAAAATCPCCEIAVLGSAWCAGSSPWQRKQARTSALSICGEGAEVRLRANTGDGPFAFDN